MKEHGLEEQGQTSHFLQHK